MGEVIIAGIGQVPVGEQWDYSLRTLAARAIQAARKDAGGLKPQALYIGNALASVVLHQSNLGSLLADNSGLEGIESYTIEAAGASGAGAFRMGYLAVASGYVDVAAVVGVEKCTDIVDEELEAAVAETTDYDYEAMQGMTPTAQAALLMQRYMHEYAMPKNVLAELAILAHANAMHNPNAMFHRLVDRAAYEKAAMISSPLNRLDMAAYCDGAAAVIMTRPDLVPPAIKHPLVRVTASSVVSDTLALHDREDPLAFKAAGLSVERACRYAGIMPSDVNLFEVYSAFSIYVILALEAAGFAAQGEGYKLVQEGALALNGRLPVCTMGGEKGRGNPLGATGIYQVVEASLQLRGEAGVNQVKNARRAMVQTLGGAASTAVTQLLERYH